MQPGHRHLRLLTPAAVQTLYCLVSQQTVTPASSSGHLRQSLHLPIEIRGDLPLNPSIASDLLDLWPSLPVGEMGMGEFAPDQKNLSCVCEGGG